jgi:uncharacterized membrane protein YkvA (DUF1232 family)
MAEASGLRNWARRIKRDVVALWLAARDGRVPLLPKVIAGLVAAYALSPVDLIPDFIPVLGYLDDVILVPLGILLAVRLVPPELMAEFRSRAEELGRRPASKWGLAMIAAIWIAGAALIILALWPVDVG